MPIEADNSGVGRRLGERLLNELEAMGASFITCYIVANCEERFYQSLGFCENERHLVNYIDKRPYVRGRLGVRAAHKYRRGRIFRPD
jgi:predicted N-acetyltransferase YhbS